MGSPPAGDGFKELGYKNEHGAFLMPVGQVGGFGAAYVTMQSLGLLPLPEAPRLSDNWI
jgi:hypothetical protein